MSKRWKAWSTAMVVSAAILVLVSTIFLWVDGDILASDTFGAKATQALTSEASRTAIAAAVVDTVLADRPIVREAVRGPAEQAISGLLGSPALSDTVSWLSTQMHRLITIGDIPGLTFKVGRVRDVLATVVSLFDEEAGARISQVGLSEEVTLLLLEDIPRLQWLLSLVPLIGTLIAIIAAVLFFCGFWRSPSRPSALLTAGLTLSLGALALMIIVPTLRPILAGAAARPVGRVLVSELFGVFAAGLQWRLGLVLAAGALALLTGLWFRAGRRFDFAWFTRSWRQIKQWAGRRGAPQVP